MHVAALDHVNIRTDDVAASALFYVEVLGLEPRNTPTPLPPEQARWLFNHAGQPIIHLYRGEHTPGSTGPIITSRCAARARQS